MKATVTGATLLGLYCLLLTVLALGTQTPGVHPSAALALMEEDIGRHR
jgi:hypothetical protein